MGLLRIHRTKYRNTGKANKALKGQQEHHVIFKFTAEENAKNFITEIKQFWYSRESVKDKVINVMNDEKPEVVQTPAKRKPGPAKGQGGRPVKKNL